MLTTRGFWFFTSTIALLAAAILLGATSLMLICVTLLLWFLTQWLLFQVRIRLTSHQLSVERALRTARGAVDSVWARQKIEVIVAVVNKARVRLPYVVVTDRLPALARLQDGSVCIDGALARETPLGLAYAIECP